MQINIDKKTGALVAIIGLLLAIILGLALNRISDDGLTAMHGYGSMGMHGDSRSFALTGADAMFLKMMIPHHQQAIDISNVALKISKDSELVALAKSIQATQSAEIIQMKSWLKDAGAGTAVGHSMSGMGGMLDSAELSALSGATGKTFNLLWLKSMIKHHDGAIQMTTMIKNASNQEIKVFGKNIIKEQSTEIMQMKQMLKRLG